MEIIVLLGRLCIFLDGNDCTAGQIVYFVGKIFQCDIVAYLNIVMNVHIWYIFKAVFAFKALLRNM